MYTRAAFPTLFSSVCFDSDELYPHLYSDFSQFHRYIYFFIKFQMRTVVSSSLLSLLSRPRRTDRKNNIIFHKSVRKVETFPAVADNFVRHLLFV